MEKDVILGILTLLGGIVASITALIKYNAYLKSKNIDKELKKLEIEAKNIEAQKDSHRLKAEYDTVVIQSLKESLTYIRPTLEKHAEKLESFGTSVEFIARNQKAIGETQLEIRELFGKVRVYFESLKSEYGKLSALMGGLDQRIEGIKTDVEKMKSGNIFVKTKK